jgi:tetrahydrodipicolinate N-succinyltransferase
VAQPDLHVGVFPFDVEVHEVLDVDEHRVAVRVKARDLSGQSGLLFRRNSITGSVEAITRTGKWGSLSTDLHAGQ